MTSQEANSIPLEDILSRYGYEPSRRYGGYDMYRSPFRCDSSPSFKVFRNENRWYDFGDSSHGRVVDLVMRIQNCSFPQAMKEIEGLGFSSGMIPQPRPVPVTAQKASGMTLLKIIPVETGICLIMPLHGASTRISSVNTAWRCITASRRIPARNTRWASPTTTEVSNCVTACSRDVPPPRILPAWPQATGPVPF